jgi:hypothetical protein
MNPTPCQTINIVYTVDFVRPSASKLQGNAGSQQPPAGRTDYVYFVDQVDAADSIVAGNGGAFGIIVLGLHLDRISKGPHAAVPTGLYGIYFVASLSCS